MSWTPPTELPQLRGKARRITIDLETHDPLLKQKGPGTFRKDNYIVGYAIGTDYGYHQYFPVRHKHGGNLDPGVVRVWLKEQLAGNEDKLGAKLSYDLELLKAEGIDVGGRKIDVQVAEPLLNENKFKYNLDVLAEERLGRHKNWQALEAAANRLGLKWRKPDDLKKYMADYAPHEVGPYAEDDVILPELIWQQQEPELRAQGLWDVFELEAEGLDMLLAMRFKGVPIDVRRAEEVGRELEDKQRELEARLKHLCGVNVSIWAADSIAQGFDRLGLPYPRTPKTNKPSFTAEWLESHPHEFARLLRETRQAAKMRSDFVESMILGSQVNGRIHPTFNPVKHDEGGTVSGRYSSDNPNLQQVPARHPVYGPLIRSMFIPEHGCLWNKHDYSQQEPRVTIHFAYLCGFPGAAEARAQYLADPNTDYHTYVANLCGVDRRSAKDINLGLAYGMGVPKMAKKLGLTEEETRVLFAKYHGNLRYMKPLAEYCMRVAANRGYVRTILGRRRRFDFWGPPRYSKDDRFEALTFDQAVAKWGMPVKRMFVHKALNAVIQGSSADMIKKALVMVHREGIVPHLTVHDEIDNSAEDKKTSDIIDEIMLTALPLEVPLKVDSFLEENWGKCK